ncbi:MAG: catalase, partial [Ilumatobacteraceae bacterium]
MAPEPVAERPVDFSLVVGTGGETHQAVAAGGVRLTTQQGIPVADDQNSLKVGERGPTLLDDFHFREKIFHFDHERIPERVVHARGFGVHGFFEPYAAAAELSRADVFQRPGERTEVFVRFSTVAGNKGSFDLARDVRGFAVKFYTRDGNWDLVGNNIPVFFIQDAIKFPDLVHAVKQEPDRGFPQAQSAHDNFWDFISLMPEATHMVMWTMSDRAIPRSYRFMEGFGVHSFRLIDADGASRYVKFHWKPAQGLQSVLWNEAVKINGADPDFHRRDLWDAISTGSFPEWELGVQVFDDEFADAFDFDVLDATKIIPEELVPVTPIGRMVLDRTVDNFFAETEQVAFCTQNVVPGIDFTNDPLLQGRNFSYLDTQLKRLGSTNFTQLPVNAPRCPVAHFQQDGHMAFANPVGRANYEPNSWGADGGPREDPATGHQPFPATESGPTRRARPASFADHYSQARQFLLSQTPIEQKHLTDALVFELSKVERPAIRSRVVANLRNVDEDLAAAVADKLGLDLPEASTPAAAPITDLPPSPALSIVANP